MTDVDTLKRYLRRALAVAHAALDDGDLARSDEARALADDVLALSARPRPAAATLSDGAELYALVERLRAVVEALDQQTAHVSNSVLAAATANAMFRA